MSLVKILVMVALVLCGLVEAQDAGGDMGGFAESDAASNDVAGSALGMTVNVATQEVTFYNSGLAPCNIGGLRLVKQNKNGTWTDLVEMPYNLMIYFQKSETLSLDVPVASGDKVILTNGVGTYNGLKVP